MLALRYARFESHPYTSECGLSVVHTSRVLEVRHKTHNRGPFQKTAARNGRSFPTPSPPMVISGGIALLDSKKADTHAHRLQSQLQLVKDPPEPASLRWLMRSCDHMLYHSEVSLSLPTPRIFKTPFGVSKSARHNLQTVYQIGP